MSLFGVTWIAPVDAYKGHSNFPGDVKLEITDLFLVTNSHLIDILILLHGIRCKILSVFSDNNNYDYHLFVIIHTWYLTVLV